MNIVFVLFLFRCPLLEREYNGQIVSNRLRIKVLSATDKMPFPLIKKTSQSPFPTNSSKQVNNNSIL